MSSWADTYRVVHEQMVVISGLAASRVFWRDQDINQPELDYVTIALTSSGTVSEDVLASTDLGRPVGEEVKIEVIGTEEVLLEVQVFSAAIVPEVAKQHAMQRAATMRAKLILPSIRTALRAVQFVPFDPQQVRYVPEVEQVRFQGRAVLDVRCYMPPIDVAEYRGYIASISGTITAKQPTPLPDIVQVFTTE